MSYGDKTRLLETTLTNPDADGSMGNRHKGRQAGMFGDAPYYPSDGTADYSDSMIQSLGSVVLCGTAAGDVATDPSALAFSSDGSGTADGVVEKGYLGGSFDLNYGESPDIAGNTHVYVANSGGGNPSSPYVPNLNSPGEGNGVDPASQAAMNTTHLIDENESQFGVGGTSADRNPGADSGGAVGAGTANTIASIKLGDVLTMGTLVGV